jgi:hypothetical protein
MAPIKQDSLNELETLGSQIEYATKLLSQLMITSSLPLPTWDEKAPAEFPEVGKLAGEIQKVRYEVIDLCAKLERLAKGPTEHVKSLISNAVCTSFGPTKAPHASTQRIIANLTAH